MLNVKNFCFKTYGTCCANFASPQPKSATIRLDDLLLIYFIISSKGFNGHLAT